MTFYKKTKKKFDRQYSLSKKITDIGMGIVYFAIGCFILLSEIIGIKLSFPPPPLHYFFGGIIIIYGIFRLYRVFVNRSLK